MSCAWLLNRAKLQGVVLGAIVGSFAVCGCEEERSVPAPDKAEPGITQGPADGPLIDEDEACQAYRKAVTKRGDALGCDDLEVAECPELIRPAGATACTRFTKSSVDECTDLIESYGSCDDFSLRRCVLVSVVDEKSEGCVPPGTD